MIVLHDVPYSIHGTKVRIVLGRKQVDWVDGHLIEKARPCQATPSAALPVLVDDGSTFTGPRNIVEYLERKYPVPRMLPDTVTDLSGERELSDFLDLRLEPAISDYIAGKTCALSVTGEFETLGKMVDRRSRERKGRGALPKRSEDVPLFLGDCGYPAARAWVEMMNEVQGTHIVLPGSVRAYIDMLEAQDTVSRTMTGCRSAIRNWVADRQKR